MELNDSIGEKHLEDQESTALHLDKSQVAFAPHKKTSPKSKQFYILIILLLLCIIFLTIIIILSLRKCTENTINFRNSSESSSELFRDEDNRICFFQEIRLPKSIVPYNYQIYLHPNISRTYFTGRVIIDCECKFPAAFVIVHARFLKVLKSVVTIDKVDVNVNFVSFCPRLDQYFIKLSKTCETNQKLQLVLSFEGKLQRRLDGFYISNYKTKAGLEKTLLTTHMEPTFARQAFPCFDEPLFKANFSLQIIRDENHYTLFNMPLLSTKKLDDGLYLDTYYPTVKMSTYLVAYMVLPLDYVYVNGTTSNSQIRIRIFGPKDKKNYTLFALDVTKKVLPFFEDLFGLDYPLPKLDMIAIPDFSAGAMENWGLITYKFFALLINPQSTKINHRTAVAKIISHEIAHQWFGNIVTMDWWNDLWLNEGFASYSEYLGGDFINKEWRMLDLFYLEQYVDALNIDSLINSHPIQVPVKDPQEIESIFDQISYGKGASLVRMLEGVLGMDTIKTGLKIYLQRYRYKTAVSDNLWTAFSEAYFQLNKAYMDPNHPVKNLKKVMSSWLDQMNYPLVTYKRTGPKTFTLSQERFLLYTNATMVWTSIYSSNHNYTWSIPLRYITDKTTEPKLIWLDFKKSQEYTFDEEYKWIKLNYGQSGFYRVNYDDQSWENIMNVLNTNLSIFSTLDRAGLLSDAFALVKAGSLKIDIALNLAKYLRHERDYIPWSIATQALSDVNKQIYLDIDAKMKFEKFGQYLIDPIMQDAKLGSWTIDNLTPYETLTRNSIMQFAVMYRHNKTMTEALELYEIFKKTKKPANTNLHYLTMLAGITEGGRNEWFYLMNIFRETKDPEQQRILRKTLAKTRDVELLNHLFFLIMSKYKQQDVVGVLFDASQGHSAGVDQAWLFIQRNWPYFEKNISHQYFLLVELFKICYGLMTESDYQQVRAFFVTKKLGFGKRSAQQSLEIIKSNIHWNQINFKPLKTWLNNFTYL